MDFQTTPKVELHLHLEGAMPPEFTRRLADEKNISLSGVFDADENGNPVIYDPACYYGDHEAELAMMELFGHPGERFFAQYRQEFPIDAGYGLRRDLYNLYHVLNHANLFGGGYASQAQAMIKGLLAQVR